jgi:hypothetical protein
MTDIITDLNAFTPALVTQLLYASGDLQRGEIVSVQADARETGMSRIAHLDLIASDDAMPALPRRLFVKLAKNELPYPDYAQLAGREVMFYRDLAPAVHTPSLVHCYAAAHRPEDYQFHLVLEDVTTINVQNFPDQWPYPPPYPLLERMLTSLAACHAAWWDHPLLGQNHDPHPANTWSPLSSQRGAEAFGQFVEELGDRLAPASLEVYERVMAAYPLLAQRLAAGKHLTIIHGDFHLGNALVPPNWQHDAIRIIDWDLWTVHLGTYDVAELLSLPWDTGRGERERALVRHYYEQLLAHGVQGYAWDSCWHDYQLAVITHLFSPLQQWVDKHWPGFWWNRVGRMLQRFYDLDCVKLLPA